jgi:hypothetical protein
LHSFDLNNGVQQRRSQVIGAVTTKYVKTEQQTATGGGGETALLSQMNSFLGSLVINANSLSAGDVFIVNAWGYYRTGGSGGTVRARLTLTPAGGATRVIADSQQQSLVASQSNAEWRFNCILTIRTINGTGTLWCDGSLVSTGLTDPNSGAGLGSEITIDTTVNQTFEMTAAVGTLGATFFLEQCSITYLATP